MMMPGTPDMGCNMAHRARGVIEKLWGQGCELHVCRCAGVVLPPLWLYTSLCRAPDCGGPLVGSF